MGVMVGLLVGYVLGTRAGKRGTDELRDAWQVVTTSREMRAMATGSLSLVGDLLARGRTVVSARLAAPQGGRHLRRVA